MLTSGCPRKFADLTPHPNMEATPLPSCSLEVSPGVPPLSGAPLPELFRGTAHTSRLGAGDASGPQGQCHFMSNRTRVSGCSRPPGGRCLFDGRRLWSVTVGAAVCQVTLTNHPHPSIHSPFSLEPGETAWTFGHHSWSPQRYTQRSSCTCCSSACLETWQSRPSSDLYKLSDPLCRHPELEITSLCHREVGRTVCSGAIANSLTSDVS